MNEIDKKLYELFADKTLSRWCIILTSEWPYEWMEEYDIEQVDDFFHFIDDGCLESLNFYQNETEKYKILWHEPHLEDVFRTIPEFIDSHWIVWYFFDKDSLYFISRMQWLDKSIPYNPTLSLMNQTDETKQFIINLFK